jgi:hypothetical protein
MRTQIRFASKLPYIGNTGSGSVNGYWTIWEARLRADGQIRQPKPVHVNFSMADLRKYKGTLYDETALPELVKATPVECPHCGRQWMITGFGKDYRICYACEGAGVTE